MRAAALALLLAMAACAGAAGGTRASAGKSDAIIRFACDVGDAELWVNERFVAQLRNVGKGIALSPGRHRVEIRHDRYHTYYQELTVTARERRTVTVTLAENLP